MTGTRIGSDEVGKGDYFGPLVVAAVRADGATCDLFGALGIAESKKVSDGRAKSLARQIIDAQVPHAIVAIGPEKYNELHSKMKNLNRLLAWAHARAIENLLEQADAELVVIDQFAAPALIESTLFQKGKAIPVHQMPRAERDPVVAAASIIARAEFLRRLDLLSQKAGLTLPKGAGPPVDQAGARLLARGGPELLRTFAKYHFKNTIKAERLRTR